MYGHLNFCAISQFSMSARSGSTRYRITFSNKVGPERSSKHIDRLILSMQSVFAENLNSSLISRQGLGHPNQYHKILHCKNIRCLKTMVGSVLSITSVKIVCRHNGIPHTLRGELT